MDEMRVRCGTSGFGHDEWVGSFYPEDLPSNQRLHHYARRLPTVEINNTFYRLPRRELLQKWMSEVPEDFVFALKAPQSITHMRRLANTGRQLSDFVINSFLLGPRLGPLLFVLPPNFARDLPRLKAFLALLPGEARAAFEFRDPSWLDDEVFAALRDHRAALCVTEGEPWAAPLVATTGWGYLRLREPRYDDAALAAWAARLAAQPWKEAFVYFRHGDEGRGAFLATKLGELVSCSPA